MRPLFFAFLISLLVPSNALATDMCLYFAEKHVERKNKESRDVLAVCLAAGCENAKLIALHRLENESRRVWGTSLSEAGERMSLDSACRIGVSAGDQEVTTGVAPNLFSDLPSLAEVEDREGDGTRLYENPEQFLQRVVPNEALLAQPELFQDSIRAMPRFD